MTALLVLISCIAAGCADEVSSDRLWTEPQAESIKTIRGMTVRVRHCDGLGTADEARYERFDCLASARTPTDRYDTVGVFYVLHPLSNYEGPHSPHRLENVRFVGGPGIP